MTPPRRNQVDLNLLPLPSRAPRYVITLSKISFSCPFFSDHFMQIPPMNSEHESSRRHLCVFILLSRGLMFIKPFSERVSAYSNPHQSTNPNVLSMIPESSYPPRYEHTYINGTSPIQPSRQPLPAPYRVPNHHQPTNHWNQPPEPLNSYVRFFISVPRLQRVKMGLIPVPWSSRPDSRATTHWTHFPERSL